MITQAQFLGIFGELPEDKLGEGWELKLKDFMLENGLCPECGESLPPAVREDRGGAYPYEYSEIVIYCPCGATFIER